MSLTENDRKLQSKKGKSFPNRNGHTRPSFVQVVAQALREEFGGGPSAIKTIARLTQANERAVRNWFEGKNGPSGESLVALIRHSDLVLRAILTLADRKSMRVAASLPGLRIRLLDLVAAIDSVHG